MAVETVAAPILPEYVGLPSHLDAESSAQGSRVYMASIALLEGGRSVSTWGYSVNLAADEKEASQEGGDQQAPAASLPTTPVAPVDHVTTGSDVSPSKTGDTGRAVIVTTTYARYNRNWEVVRANCVLKTVAAAAEHGYSIVTADGGSPPGYIEEMQRLGAHVFAQKEPGMGNARREALRHALATAKDAQAIVWIEPEKYPIVPLLASGVRATLEGNDLVMFRRRSLDTYPPEQAMTYRLIGLAFLYLTGIDCDFGFGPMCISRHVTEYFLAYKSQYSDLWDSIHIPKLRIIHDGLPYTNVDIDYQHPPEQTATETGMELFMKRIEQVHQLTDALTREVERLKAQPQQ